MQLSTHLLFSGACQEAFSFYAECFGGSSLRMLTYGDSPAAGEASANWQDKILHATLIIGNSTLSGADVLPEQHENASGFYVLLDVDDVPEANRIFNALAKGGVVRMPLKSTFWSPAFGVVIDRFGTPWEINCAGARGGDDSPIAVSGATSAFEHGYLGLTFSIFATRRPRRDNPARVAQVRGASWKARCHANSGTSA